MSKPYQYSLKLINPSRKSDYKTVNILDCPRECLATVTELREFMSSACDVEDIAKVDIGYVEPGHGSKGKKVWICSDDDVKAMYKAHKGRLINLWCYTEKQSCSSKGKKRSRSHNGDKGTGSKYESHSAKKMAAVNVICDKLRENHSA